MADYVFSMRNVRKAHGDKVVLDNVTLSFLHGAKIGVVGPNGTGKSTMVKIMAGLETPSNGDALLDPDATVGILLQEPPLTEGKTVLDNVEEAVADTKAKLTRFNEITVELADPDADYDALLPEMGDLQTDLDHANAWDLDSRLEQAMDALRCPPPDVLVDRLSGGERRRVALCKLLLQPQNALGVEVVGRLVEQKQIRLLQQQLAQGDPTSLTTGQVVHQHLRRRAPQGVHRLVETAVEVPRVGMVQVGLQVAHLAEQLVVVGVRVGELLGNRVVAVQLALDLADGLLDVLEHRAPLGQRRLLLEHPDGRIRVDDRVAVRGVVEPRHDLEQRRLAGAVGTHDADLRAVQEGEGDIVEDDLVTMGFAHIAQREYILSHVEQAYGRRANG